VASERWSVRVAKDDAVFAAAHFITYGGGQCEPIHGHNYRVWVEVWGELDENHYVVDFISLKQLLVEITRQLNHRLLLPRDNPWIQVQEREHEVEARFGGRRWVVPRGECVILPVSNTTAELLAKWIASQVRQRLGERLGVEPDRLVVEVEENVGQRARYEWFRGERQV